MFSESLPERLFSRAGGGKHSAGLSFFAYFFACPDEVGRQAKKYEKILQVALLLLRRSAYG